MSKGYGGQDGPPALTIRKPLVDLNRDWAEDGECRKPENEWVDFFPLMNDEEAVAKAKDVCSRCPVFIECGRFAKANDIGFGIWGGMTPGERDG